MELRRLQRGINAKIDKLLDYLEIGCFDALSKKYLKSIVLSVLIDRTDPKVVLFTLIATLQFSQPLKHIPFPSAIQTPQDTTMMIECQFA